MHSIFPVSSQHPCKQITITLTDANHGIATLKFSTPAVEVIARDYAKSIQRDLPAEVTQDIQVATVRYQGAYVSIDTVKFSKQAGGHGLLVDIAGMFRKDFYQWTLHCHGPFNCHDSWDFKGKADVASFVIHGGATLSVAPLAALPKQELTMLYSEDSLSGQILLNILHGAPFNIKLAHHVRPITMALVDDATVKQHPELAGITVTKLAVGSVDAQEAIVSAALESAPTPGAVQQSKEEHAVVANFVAIAMTGHETNVTDLLQKIGSDIASRCKAVGKKAEDCIAAEVRAFDKLAASLAAASVMDGPSTPQLQVALNCLAAGAQEPDAWQRRLDCFSKSTATSRSSP